MHLFSLVRTEDVSGVSGTGTVAHGVEFDDGQVVMQWNNTGSICIYKSAQQLEEVHGHEGRTKISWE
jgi:hypothetical protein